MEKDPSKYCAYADLAANNAVNNHDVGCESRCYCEAGCGVYYFIRPRLFGDSNQIVTKNKHNCFNKKNQSLTG